LLELPVFDPGTHYGGIYMYYDMRALKQRPGGYSTLAPKETRRVARRLEPLGCGEWSATAQRELRRLGVESIVLHPSLYGRGTTLPQTPWFAWRALPRHGWGVVDLDRGLVLYRRTHATLLPRLSEPSRGRAWLCAGWAPEDKDGREITEPHASLWLYGSGTGALRLKSTDAATARFSVDGRTVARRDFEGTTTILLPLRGRRWHLVAVDRANDATLRLLGVTSPSRGTRSRRRASWR
jgi:hypothetical protein